MTRFLACLVVLLCGGWAAAAECDIEDTINNWQVVLDNYVHNGSLIDGIYETSVDYMSLRRALLAPSPTGAALNYTNTMNCLADMDTSRFTESENMAMLINAYNIFAIDMVVRNPCKTLFGKFCWQIRSIRDISGLFQTVWDLESFTLAGKTVSLQMVENQVESYQDPRVHSSIVCASASCPNLQEVAFFSDQTVLDQQLNASMTDFLANPKKGLSCTSERSCTNALCYLSSIFNWYASQFPGATNPDGSINDVGLLSWLYPYAPDEAKVIMTCPGVAVEFLAYDWDLNGYNHRGEEIAFQ